MRTPYFPMYPVDFEGKTSHLSLEEDGAYNRLLRLMWMSPECRVPDDPAWLARRLRIDAETFERVVKPVIDEFMVRRNGFVWSARLREEWEKVSETYRKRSEAGKKGGRPQRTENSQKEQKAGLSQPKGNRKQPEPEPEPEPEPDKDHETEVVPTSTRDPAPPPAPSRGHRPGVCRSEQEALANEVQAILDANGDRWAWAGLAVMRWQEAGATPELIRAVAKSVRGWLDAKGKPPPSGAEYLDKPMQRAIEDTRRQMPAPDGNVTPLRKLGPPTVLTEEERARFQRYEAGRG